MKYKTMAQLRAEFARRQGVTNEHRWFAQEQLSADDLLRIIREKREGVTVSQYFADYESAQEYAFLMSLQGHRMIVKDMEQ